MGFKPVVARVPHHIGAVSFQADVTLPPRLTGETFVHPETGNTIPAAAFGTARRSYKICDEEGGQISWEAADHSDLHPFTIYLLGQALAFQSAIDAAKLDIAIDLVPTRPVRVVTEPVIEPTE